ncbi:hypothetical protein [uncultured Imperialibacter sp.]|uniref:hypothetical protein n=1 Tax=uncultured Imperialibacter sp. TaxID=1672639 RepID=UPI0030DA6D18|tara:strand:- start:1277 stop:1855 length:579 start_codon:yes stop_codon:yes gene_type:complete
MKKIQLSIILTLLCFAAYAQFDGTSYVLGGNASFNYGDYFSKSTSFSLSPSMAKPVRGNALVGLQLGFGLSSSKYEDDNNSSKYNSVSYNPGVYYQKFYGITENIFFNWKASGSVSFNKSVTDDSNAKTTEHSTSYQVTAGPGISWKVMDRVLLNGSIGGVSLGLNSREASTRTSFNISFNNPQFGFSFLLN